MIQAAPALTAILKQWFEYKVSAVEKALQSSDRVSGAGGRVSFCVQPQTLLPVGRKCGHE